MVLSEKKPVSEFIYIHFHVYIDAFYIENLCTFIYIYIERSGMAKNINKYL